MTAVKKAIIFLERMAAGGVPLDESQGVCWHLDCLDLYAYYGVGSTLDLLMRSWGEYSGNPEYPVDHPNGPSDGFVFNDNLWDPETEYGRARRRLCGFLASELQKIYEVPNGND